METRFTAKERGFAIDPDTAHWPMRRRVGFGILALMPTTLLLAALTLGVAHFAMPRTEIITDLAAILLYVHVAAQGIVLLIFGHLLFDHEGFDLTDKVWWGAAFLFAAPVSIPIYWVLHILAEGKTREESKVHVYDTSYVDDGEADGDHDREDGTRIHNAHSEPPQRPFGHLLET